MVALKIRIGCSVYVRMINYSLAAQPFTIQDVPWTSEAQQLWFKTSIGLTIQRSITVRAVATGIVNPAMLSILSLIMRWYV